MVNLDITRLEEAVYSKVWSNKWKVIGVDEISGRLNVMWLTPGGKGISTHALSHMTILNMILDNYSKSDEEPFWNIGEISKHNVDDPIILNKRQDYESNNNNELADLMIKFMKHTGFVRISGPYRNQSFGGSSGGYGHAHRLLERPDFNVESFTLLTEPQVKFLNKILDVYSIGKNEANIHDYIDGFGIDKDKKDFNYRVKEQLYG
jgi:hypothetical protein